MNNSQSGIEVFVRDDGEKKWARVVFPSYWKEWVPSFEDLFRIIQGICYCEDVRYPNGRGREMVRDFLNDAVDICGEGILATPQELQARWDHLKSKYEIPDR